jgi:tRNA(fMet)-specific endonuclease VapC
VYLLDTNICIAIINQNPLAVSEFAAKISQCYISTIIIGELYKGAYCSQEFNLI